MSLFGLRKTRQTPALRKDISGCVVTGPAATHLWWSRDTTYPGKARASTRAANKVARRSRRINRLAAR